MNALIKNFSAFSRSVVFAVLMLTPGACFAHNEYVHEQITQSAFNSSSALAVFITENSVPQTLTASSPQCSGSQSPMEWLRKGSYYEDEQTYGWRDEVPGVGPFQRCSDHFYTVRPQRIPGLVDGLTDFSEPAVLAHMLLSGHTTNSFAWGTQDGIKGVGNVGYNLYKWSDARTNELAALTNTAPGGRNTSMAMMFYSLGHVLHLNQDLTSPDHVRDNAHPWGHYFESYGKAHWNDPNKNQKWFVPPQHDQPGWTYWQTQGFTNLLNFWDRNKYEQSSGSDGLKADARGDSGAKLGLAEFCNGNFLGERSLYMECYNPNNKHYFPYPCKSSTDYPGKTILTTITPNGRNLPTTITRNVVRKTRDGVAGFNHSILSYLGTKFPNARTSHSTTINDDDVLQDYHDRLIPKAAEYSTGILDYFFRGTMDFWVTGDDSESTITVHNTSSQDFHDGMFFILIENNGVRTLVQSNLLNGLLPPGGRTNFTCNHAAANEYFVFYQGTIGWTNGAAQDPVDATNAVAVGCQIWRSSFEGVSNLAEATQGDYFAEGWYVDSGSVDFGPWGQAYEGISLLDLDGINPGTISTNIPTAQGQT